MPTPLASHSILKVLPKSGSARSGAEVNLSFAWNDFSYASPHVNGISFFVNHSLVQQWH
jgi:hypothetical protein